MTAQTNYEHLAPEAFKIEFVSIKVILRVAICPSEYLESGALKIVAGQEEELHTTSKQPYFAIKIDPNMYGCTLRALMLQ